MRYPWPILHDDAYHGIAGEFVHLMAPFTEADPPALLIQTLADAGSIMGRRCYALIEGTRHCGNIYTCLVGKTSEGRKGTSKGRVNQIWRRVPTPETMEWTMKGYNSGLSSGEGLVHAVRDPRFKVKNGIETDELEDGGVTDKRLMVVESEFGKVLTNMSRGDNILSHIMRQAWDGGVLQLMNKNTPEKASYPHISIVAHITPDELHAKLKAVEMANGFGNRFLLWMTRRSKLIPLTQNVEESLMMELAERFGQILYKARGLGPMADEEDRQIEFDDEARDLWIAEYPRLAKKPDGMLGAMIGRKEPYIRRLALIYGLLDGDLISTKAVHLKAALAVWQYAEDSAKYLFGGSTGEPLSDLIWKTMVDIGHPMPRQLIREEIGKNRPAEQIEAALQRLHDQGIAGNLKVGVSSKGRKTEFWFLRGDEEPTEEDIVAEIVKRTAAAAQRPPPH